MPVLPMNPPNGAAPASPVPQDPAMQEYQQKMQIYQQQMQQWQQIAQAAQQAQAANQAAQKKFDDAVALIKKDGALGFRIDIEADSTITPDEEAEKESRTEFMREFVPFLGQIVPFCQGNPAAAAMGEKLTLFVIRPFKVARTLEESVTEFFESLKSMPPPQQGDKGGGADSPQDLAVRANDTKARVQIAQGQNMVKLAQINSNERINADKLALAEKQHHDTLAAGISKEADMRAFRDIRGAAIEAKEAQSLQ